MGERKKKRDKKVLTGTTSAVNWLCLSGLTDVGCMTPSMEHIGGFLRISYLGTSLPAMPLM